MFEIGFFELVIIGIVALIVIGPERLPGVARQVGFWIGRAKSLVSSMQTEFSDEMRKVEEVKELVTKEMEIKEIHESIDLDLETPTITTIPENKRNSQPSELASNNVPNLDKPKSEPAKTKISK